MFQIRTRPTAPRTPLLQEHTGGLAEARIWREGLCFIRQPGEKRGPSTAGCRSSGSGPSKNGGWGALGQLPLGRRVEMRGSLPPVRP